MVEAGVADVPVRLPVAAKNFGVGIDNTRVNILTRDNSFFYYFYLLYIKA